MFVCRRAVLAEVECLVSIGRSYFTKTPWILVVRSRGLPIDANALVTSEAMTSVNLGVASEFEHRAVLL